MKRALTAGLLCCTLLGAGLAIAGATKFTFFNITYPDGTPGTIRAAVKITSNSDFTHCDYSTPTDAYLGMYESSTFASTDAIAVEDFCWAHYYQRH